MQTQRLLNAWIRRAASILFVATSFVALESTSSAIEHDIVISIYQGECREGEFSKNLDTVRRMTAEAVKRGSHFVAFPECFLSGYEDRDVAHRGARSLDDGELTAWIAETAAHDSVVLVGLARKEGESLWNSVLVVHRGRLQGVYDKVMLTGGDSAVLGFQAGTSVPIFAAHGVKFSVNICHDTSFPQPAMLARFQGAEILFTPHNNEIGANVVDEHRRSVRNCHIGLATQLKMIVARANNVKSDRAGRLGYGDSFILSPQGTPIAEAQLFKSELITAKVTPAMFNSPWVWADMSETPAWLRTQLGQILTEFRRPATEDELRYWLRNMAVDHRFRADEISSATGLTLDEIHAALKRFSLAGQTPAQREPNSPLRVLPYPGGRHPRLGFFDGALMPQRETKVSVFLPWDDTSYVVADMPEAIFSNLGLLYLAHTHVPTIWDVEGVRLPRLEWSRHTDGRLTSERRLPNGVAFGATVTPGVSEVRMRLWLKNDTAERLTGLRVQNCVMLGAARGFAAQSNANKLFRAPYAAARSESGDRWIITAWDPIQRCWGNERCPCLHADPQFPDCSSGETVSLRGWLSFFEGTDIDQELARIEATGWRHAVSDDE